MRSWRLVACSAAFAAGAACTGHPVESAGGALDQTARLTLRITGDEAPPTLSVTGQAMPPGSELIAGATVTIGAVTLVGGEDGPITLTDMGGEFDLIALHSGVDALLASVDVPAGTYHQLRLVVVDATVTLVEGTVFADGAGTRDLFVPSGAQSGIKVALDDGDDEPGLTVVEGEQIVLLDFDVSRNFVLTGPPGAPHSALFTPSVRVRVMP